MKKFALLFALLISCGMAAQNYKPLEPVEVPDYPTNIIRVSKNNYMSGDVYYTASHMLTMRSISADISPVNFDIHVKADNAVDLAKHQAVLKVGGVEYTKYVDFVSEINNGVYINILGDHVKHIAVSGLQEIVFKKQGQVTHTITFNAIEQELWRRTADELIKAVAIYDIL